MPWSINMNANIKTALNLAVVVTAAACSVYASKKLGEALGRGSARMVLLGRAAYKTEQAFDEIIDGNKKDGDEHWQTHARAQLAMLWNQNTSSETRRSKYYVKVSEGLNERFERRMLLKADINGATPSTDTPE
jgi:hypothetical protein